MARPPRYGSPSWQAGGQASGPPGSARSSNGEAKLLGDHIGGRIRQRRTELGLTQEQLARTLGISYQQVQKYETAANRVSASRLYELAQEFGVDITYFFDGFEGSSANGPLPHGGHNRTAIDLVRNFLRIEDDALRGAVSGLLKALRERNDESEACTHNGARLS